MLIDNDKKPYGLSDPSGHRNSGSAIMGAGGYIMGYFYELFSNVGKFQNSILKVLHFTRLWIMLKFQKLTIIRNFWSNSSFVS